MTTTFKINGIVKLDADTELLNPSWFVKACSRDYEEDLIKIDVVFYESNYRHVRTYVMSKVDYDKIESDFTEVNRVVLNGDLITGFEFV